MQELKFGVHASDVNFRKDDNVWDINLKYELEQECIHREMRQKAGKGLDYLSILLDPITNVYAKASDQEIPDTIWKKAVRGDLERESPAMKSVSTMRIAFWIALLAEISVLLVQQAVAGDFNPFIVILAVILGLGGFLQGVGIGHLLFKRWQEDTSRFQGDRTTQDWMLIGIGTFLILLVSLARSSGSFDPLQFFIVFCITFFFGEAVAICEALAVKLSAQRCQCLQDMGQAQAFQARQLHTKNLTDGIYNQHYETIVRNADQGKYQMDPNPNQPSGLSSKSPDPSNA